jgi:hypothetical protein
MGVKKKFKNFLLKRNPVSSSAIKPGDVLVFNYFYIDKLSRNRKNERLVLVVKSKRASTGVFTSSRGNILLSCFNLGFKSEGTITIILDQLYKNSKDSSYTKINENQINGLKALLGIHNYRTFKFSNMKNLFKVRIK